MTEESVFKRIYALKTIAVVGCSPKPERPSHYVALFLRERGYRIIPVNPGHVELLGVHCYPDLASIGESVDIVEVFRRSEEVPLIVEDAIKIKAQALWLQDGVSHPEAEARARAAGMLVVSNDCLMRRLSSSS